MDTLSRIFAALADPTRRAILQRLAQGEATVQELAEPFDISLPAISKHLKVLEEAKLITRSRDAQYRPARLDPAALKEASQWIDEYRQFWEERFDRLSAYMETLIAAGTIARTAREGQNTEGTESKEVTEKSEQEKSRPEKSRPEKSKPEKIKPENTNEPPAKEETREKGE